MTNPFHDGERALQETVSVQERLAKFASRAIRPFMPDQHREFFAQLPFLVVGSVDDAGDAWATLLFGDPGFAHTPDETTLSLDVEADASDPASGGLADGASLGVLGIELHTRRRNRVNGILTRRPAGFDLRVVHSFGNCPKYIQTRTLEHVEVEPGELTRSTSLGERARKLVARSDTFFVATYVDLEERQVDVSHRGGERGFVRVDARGVLTIPDYRGNSFFNTLGNITLQPKTGLTFADFETGDMLQMTGDAHVELDPPDLAEFEGAQRLWRFTPREVVLRERVLPLRSPSSTDRSS